MLSRDIAPRVFHLPHMLVGDNLLLRKNWNFGLITPETCTYYLTRVASERALLQYFRPK